MERGIEEIRVTAPRKLSRNGLDRVSASVNGEELFFESAEIELVPVAELFATALLPLAAFAGTRLNIDAALDPLWMRNADRVMRVWNRWWRTPGELVSVLVARADGSVAASRRAPEPRTGLCFTLGVDSFHSLLRSGHRVDGLLFAEGYDMALGDSARSAAVRASLEEVARATGAAPAVIRTNLREHPVGRGADWGRTHGGAVAALGHAAADTVGELLIASTKPYFADAPWGSHWETDPGWSSSRVRVIHVGAELRRNDKLAQLLDERLVQRHLRVCWENRAPTGNCGECEKCLRTMLILTAHDRLTDFPVFPRREPLSAQLDALPSLPPYLIPVYAAELQRLDRPLRRSVERLIGRSGA
jgi:hypothetical protein